MLAMAVVNHQGGGGTNGIGGGSKGIGGGSGGSKGIGLGSGRVEEEDDILTRLRYLHQTLQECHWRVGRMDQQVEALQPNLQMNFEELKTSRLRQMDGNPIKVDTKQITSELMNGIYDKEASEDLEENEVFLQNNGRGCNYVGQSESDNMYESKSSAIDEQKNLTLKTIERNRVVLDKHAERENTLHIVKKITSQNSSDQYLGESPLLNMLRNHANSNTVEIESSVLAELKTVNRHQVTVDTVQIMDYNGEVKGWEERKMSTNEINGSENHAMSEQKNAGTKVIGRINLESVNIDIGEVPRKEEDLQNNSTVKQVNSVQSNLEDASYSKGNRRFLKRSKRIPSDDLQKQCESSSILKSENFKEETERLGRNERSPESITKEVTKETFPENERKYPLKDKECSELTENKRFGGNERKPESVLTEEIIKKTLPETKEKYLLKEEECSELTERSKRITSDDLQKQSQSSCILKSESFEEEDERLDRNERSPESIMKEVTKETFPETQEKYPLKEEESSELTKQSKISALDDLQKQHQSSCISRSESFEEDNKRLGRNERSPELVTRKVTKETLLEFEGIYPLEVEECSDNSAGGDNEGIAEISYMETPDVPVPEITEDSLDIVEKSLEHIRKHFFVLHNSLKQSSRTEESNQLSYASQDFNEVRDEYFQNNSKIDGERGFRFTRPAHDSHRKYKPTKLKTKKKKIIINRMNLDLVTKDVYRDWKSLAKMFIIFMLLLMLLLFACYLLLAVPIVTLSIRHNGGAVAY